MPSFRKHFKRAASATAQESPPPVTADDLRALLQDSNGDLSRLAQGVVGKNGGNQLFYFPTRDEPTTPAAWGLKYESIDFKSGDGTALHGWFIPAKNKSAKSAKGTVVFSHGNAGSISHHLGFCTWLAEASYNVIVYAYRGFGKSGGTVDRRGHYLLPRSRLAVNEHGEIGRGNSTDERAERLDRRRPADQLVLR